MRDECKGCIFAGETIHCSGMELLWALYNAKKETPILRIFAKEPAPCWQRIVESEEEQ